VVVRSSVGGEAGADDAPVSGELFDADAEVVAYRRSPRDVLWALALAVVAAGVVLATRFVRRGTDGIEADLSSVLDAPSQWLATAIDLTLIVFVVVVGVALFAVPLLTRRFRLLGYVVTASFVGSLTVAGIDAWVGIDPPSPLPPGASAAAIARSLSVDVSVSTQLVAAFVVTLPFLGGRWRRAGWWLVGFVLVLRLAVSDEASTHVALVLSVGALVGVLVLLAYGRPETRVRPSSVVAALTGTGLEVHALCPTAAPARWAVPYVADVADGSVFVRVLGGDRRAADLLTRIVRAIRLRNVGDERPFSSLRRAVEHEALVSLSASAAGVAVPRLRALAPVGDDAFVLANDLVVGTRLADLDAGAVDDALLSRVWLLAAQCRSARLAHRGLGVTNILVDDDGQPWLVGVGEAEIAASDTLLRADLAELLTSLATVVGAERAVSTAVGVLGAETVGSCAGRLQPAALTPSTQAALKRSSGLLDAVRHEVLEQCGIDEPPLEPVVRIGARQIFTVVMLVAIFYFLLPQFADLPGIVEQVRSANWRWAVPLLVASAATYVFATVALMGSVPGRLPPGLTTTAQLGTSFTNNLAPAGVGGMALNVRFLQRQGVDAAVATSAVGLNTVAGVVAHVVLLGVFVLWTGNTAVDGLRLPSPRALLIGVGVVVGLALVALAVPATRALVRRRLAPVVGRAVTGLRDVLRSPAKIALLLGGSALVTLSYLLAFVAAAEAFGLDVRFAALGSVFLLGSAIAVIAPTPGGLGAVEAALVAGLVAVGVTDAQAVPAVFLFRLGTFWLPIAPGWFAFEWLRRTGRL
jgi:uncharacterized membrane protein YbhN (UPF0104 family)